MANFIYPHHRNEWKGSKISEEIIELNLRSLKVEPYGARDEAIELLADLDNIKRDNTGRISRSELNKYSFLNDGGWRARGADLQNGGYSDFITLKPENPRWDSQKQKHIKYEHPRGRATEIFAPLVSFADSAKIVAKSKNDEFQKDFLKRLQDEIDKEEIKDSNSLLAITRENCKNGAIEEVYQTSQKLRNKKDGFEYLKCEDSKTLLNVLIRLDEGFWESVKTHPVSVGVTEGYKKAASILTQGYPCVAVPGIWNWIDQDAEKFINFKGEEKRRKELTRHLTPLCKVKREFFLAFDEDEKASTRRNVELAQEVLGKVLSKNGGKVSILYWKPEDGKGIDDAIALNGANWFKKVYEQRLSLSAWLYWNQKLSHVDQRLNKQFLTKDDIDSIAKILGIKSPKGTGKTEAIGDYVQEYINAGIPVLLLSHRRQLVEALSERFGIDNAYNFRVSDTRGVLGLALCSDSLHSNSQVNFNPHNWDDFVLIIDEVEQMIPHTLISTGTDVANHRTEVLANLSTLCQNAKQIILSDADLSDRGLNYISSLTGHCQQKVIVNDFQPAKGRKLYNYPSPEALLHDLLLELDDPDSKVLIPIDAQRASSKWGSQTVETYIKTRYPHLKVLRIDSETVANPEHEAFGIANLINQAIKDYDVVIYTPVLGTGISIDVENHFTAVYSFNQGTQSENSTRQFLARLRDDIPRHCYFKPIGVGFMSGGETEPRAVKRSNKSVTKRNICNLTKLDNEALEFDSFGNHVNAYCSYVANHNLGLSAYREIVLEGLKREGYEIIQMQDIEKDDKKPLGKTVTTTRDINYDKETSAIAQIETPSDEELTKLESKHELTDSQRYQLRKGKMEKRYGVEADKELVEQDDDGLYPQLSLLFWLTVGRDQVEEADHQKAKKYADTTGGKGYSPDFNRTQNQAKVQVLEALRIPEIIAMEGEEVTNSSIDWWWQHIQDICENKNAKTTVKQFLNLTISDKETPIRNLGKILNRVGYELAFSYQKGKNEGRERVYTVERITDKQDVIFSHWLEKVNDDLKPRNVVNFPKRLTSLINYINDDSIPFYGNKDRTLFNLLAKDDVQKSVDDLRAIHPHVTNELARSLINELIESYEEVA
ncbi:DUF3854 domain-containing protein (plasmid) [Euhalothece natronophila Z-M001]|uniref:DUF3854 domain-containing protein n=1 Tax=Euhalothece natronophila Z-M001 TaxID=522448 RepID=A0A5B8NRE9_9CHRO|nr:plasmid replication protein, CyRepA1 family [Euhalothece natronophila]QDZ41654.1 DUF3854 domain-containing protein [Euhalothece natronophila Z-M001]